MSPHKKEKKNIVNVLTIGICFLVVLICLGFCSSPNSLFVAPVTEYLGISRSAFAIKDSLRFIFTAIVNVFFGFLINKFGSKKLICAGVLCLIGAMCAYSFGEHVAWFYLGGSLLGIGFSWTSTTMVGYVVNRRCSKNRGTIMGAVLAANGVGGAIAMQILSPIINEKSNLAGYKNAYLLVALILAVLFVLILFLYNDKKPPERAVQTALGKKGRGQKWTGIEYSKLTKRAYFYCSLIFIFFTGLVLQSITGISAAHLRDVGLDSAYIATVLSCHSIALACFKFLTGFIYDKFGLRVTTLICTFTSVLVTVLLALVTNSAMGMVFAMIYGILSALALPLETIMLPIFASDMYGEKSYSKILGIFVSANTAGYALGSPIINLFFDLLGSYKIALFVFAGIMVCVIILMQSVITVANKERKKIEEQEMQNDALLSAE